MRILRSLVAGAVAALAALPAALAAQNHDVSAPATSAMTADELRATGVATLSARQRAALDAWLRSYTDRMLAEQSPRAPQPLAPPVTRDLAPQPAPRSYDNAPPPRRRVRVPTPAGALRIVALIDGGDAVRLENGLVYRVYGRDHTKSSGWRNGQALFVKPAPVIEGDDYDTVLTNTADGTQVLAKLSRPD